ncbi:uncharacterized protein LOC102713103 isoform X2 [Oryza brachyantha]|uniref:uncharacterized protein LOC102713103 isoform X2 n=1 Tax=Oryza brachyantha TaxID=4533 RepID=UPI000776105A|nr:uncharacterized protein LOC102713103 isoform X2 [Oryza brachyantha]
MDRTPGKSSPSKRRRDARAPEAAAEVIEREAPVASAPVEGTPKGKKSKSKKGKKHKQQESPSSVSDASAIVTHKDLANESGNGYTSGEGATTSTAPVLEAQKEVDEQEAPNISASVEVQAQKGKKLKDKKRKKHKQQESSSAVMAATDLFSESGIGCTSGEGTTTSMAPVQEADEQLAPTVSASVEAQAQKGKKSKEKKRKRHKQQESHSDVSDVSAIVTDTDLVIESGNRSTSGEGALRDADVVPSPRSEHDPTPEMDRMPGKSKASKRRCGATTSMPVALEAEKEVDEQETTVTSTAVERTPDDLANESGDGCRSGEAALQDVDVVSSRNGQDPKCPEVNSSEDSVAGKKGDTDDNSQLCSSLHESYVERRRRKNRERKRRKKENANRSNVQNPSSQPSATEVGLVTTADEDNTPGSKCKNPSLLPGAGEVGLVMTADGNNTPGSECKKSNKKRKRNQTIVSEAPLVQRMGLGETASVGMMDEVQPILSDSRHARSDRSDVLSNLGQMHKEKYRDIYSPRGSLIRFQRKKLLILDINGLLADINQDHHNAHMSDAKVRGKLVFRRPYCNDFLKFCFQKFELGIWSSRLKANVDAVINIIMEEDMKESLLFCWDLSKCTGTKFKTLENKDKPLVLKELKKLWNKEDPDLPWEQGEFSPSNTLLVDDSPYKALGNPSHTAIFPHPYRYLDKKDNSLAPGGDLRVYLENLAAAADVQSYVREHPFGQPSITKSHQHWGFYVKVLESLEKPIA